MANFGIFDDDFVTLEGSPNNLLLANGTDFLTLFPQTAVRDRRQFPDDGFRNWPTPIDLQRKWPDI